LSVRLVRSVTSGLEEMVSMADDPEVRPESIHVFDIATGVVMHQRGCDAREARQHLLCMASDVGQPLGVLSDVVTMAAAVGCRVEPQGA
jgi:AmiR/NasT family two-component response regulator